MIIWYLSWLVFCLFLVGEMHHSTTKLVIPTASGHLENCLNISDNIRAINWSSPGQTCSQDFNLRPLFRLATYLYQLMMTYVDFNWLCSGSNSHVCRRNVSTLKPWPNGFANCLVNALGKWTSVGNGSELKPFSEILSFILQSHILFTELSMTCIFAVLSTDYFSGDVSLPSSNNVTVAP